MALLNSLFNILMVALGLGFVIFIHELGHFLLAKWNGVKVEKFSIGFGPSLLEWRYGETEYALAAFPLGGFVKMLGEGESGEADAKHAADPRSYQNKPVGSRMAIISAGVIMNLIFGFVCFVLYYRGGAMEIPPRIGTVVAGLPAFEAGIRPGDEIVAVNGRRGVDFNDLVHDIRLSRAGQTLHLDLKRPGQDGLIAVTVQPQRKGAASMPEIGIAPDTDLVLTREEPFQTPAGLDGWPRDDRGRGIPGGARLVAIQPPKGDPRSVADTDQLNALLARYADQPLKLVFERAGSETKAQSPPKERVTVTIPPVYFVDLGIRPELGPVSSIQAGSPAEKAGFRDGDLIRKVDGKAEFDPMRLPTLCYRRAGRPMTFEVQRSGSGQKVETLTAIPDDTPPWIEPVIGRDEPLKVPGLGLAYHFRPKVRAVVDGSPAARVGLKPGDTLRSLTLIDSDPKAEVVKAHTFTFSKDEKNPVAADWAGAFLTIQDLPRQAVRLLVNDNKEPILVTPELDRTWARPARGLVFRPLIRKLPPQGVMASLRRGTQDTVENIVMIYAMVRSLVEGRVGAKNLGGPIRIAAFAYQSASSGLNDLIHFLGLLSVNLAVLNFLPIPPLDGGQMAFLIAEKLRGRPVPEPAMAVGTYIGIALVLLLLVFVLYQDVMSFF